MKKTAFLLSLFLSFSSLLISFQANVDSAHAEIVATAPDLSSLPVLPYDFRGTYQGTVYLKNRVVFQNIKGEYMAFDVEDGAKTGLNLVWWNKWSPTGYQSLLPNTSLIYANFVPGSAYSSYKFVNGEWASQNYATDENSLDFYAEWVLMPGVKIAYSTLDLINANGQIFSYATGQWTDATFEECRENSIYSAKDYDFALPAGLYANISTGGIITARTHPSPKYICNDGIDNDGDGTMDKNDPGCHTDWDVNNSASYNQKIRSEGEDSIKRLPVQDSGIEVNAGAGPSTFSGDGKLIAYASITGSGGWSWNNRADVFLYNTTTGKNERISVTPDGTDANGQSGSPAISSDGKYVVFQSGATNLASGKTDNSSSDIFLRDLTTNTTILVSRGMDGKAAGRSSKPSIGGKDGKYISFESEASNLVPNDNNGCVDVFVYNIDTREIKFVSSAMDGTTGNGYSYAPSISSHSNFVAFASTSSNLIPNDVNGGGGGGDIFVRNLDTDEIERVSLSWEGKKVYGYSNSASISPDGRYVSFYSSDSSFVPDDTDRWADTFVYDRVNKSLERISVSADGQQGNGDSYQAYLSSGGKYAVFSSYADNLASGDTNAVPDVFIRNQTTHEIRKISIASDGAQGNSGSYPLGITPNGKYILVSSGASNLVKGDVNNTTDTFIIRNPFEPIVETSLPTPTELKQKNESDGLEVGVGKIINEGAAESADSVILSGKVESMNGERVALEIQIESVDEVSGAWTSYEPIRSEYVPSGQVVSIEYAVSKGGLYTWRVRTVNEVGGESDWSHFGDNGIGADFISSNFSFVFLTDVHLGSLTTVLASANKENWYELQSYPRFTDILYDIEKMSPEPDFILIGGDNVEYNNSRWLEDFKSITEGYTARTGIAIYFVPGNHDRYDSESTAFQWGQTDLSGGNDKLFNYSDVIEKPKGVISLFAADNLIMNAPQSEHGGINRYNYYFNHKGMQLIGLDSGEDVETNDLQPEGSGISERVLGYLNDLAQRDSEISRVVFMHHPVYDGGKDPAYNDLIPGALQNYKGSSRTVDTDDIAENESFVDNWQEFIDYCDEENVQLVMSGHTHEDKIWDGAENKISLSNWKGAYPLYLQTQSATKKDNHGYRVVEVKNGKAIPHEAITGVKKYEKVYTDLNAESPLDFLAYDSDGNEITIEDDDKATMFLAKESDRRILYNDTEKSHFEVKNNSSIDSSYDLHLQKREEWAEPAKQPESVHGYHIYNKELCSGNASYCNGFLAIVEGGDYRTAYFKNIKIKENSSHVAFVDWNEVKTNRGGFSTKVEGIHFGVNGDYDNLYGYDEVMVAVDLNSPGELRAYDKNGNVTGLVNGEIVENIPNSIYVPESETVYIFGNSRQEVTEGLRTQVVGSYEATYDFSITLSENDEEKSKFMADDVLINGDTTHQFSVDWEALGQGEKGVTMEFDENKDDTFEKSIFSDGSLSFPKAKLNPEKYLANEGAEITFDASASSDSDGSIVLYEWDFDGDGIYDASSSNSTIAHIYGDDFEGKVYLRVTDNEGLTDISSITSAEVTIANMNPVASISKFEIADTMDKFILEADFIDSGWLDTHTASIDWGDGSVENISITEENIFPDTTGRISVTHRYAELCNYVVKLMVTDDDGGTVTAEGILKGSRQMKRAVLLKFRDIETNDKDALKEIEQSIASLEESLSDEYWQDDFHLDPVLMNKFFSLDQKTIKSLEKIVSGDKKYADFESHKTIQETIDEIMRSNIFLARSMIYETGSLEANNLESAKNWIEKMLKIRSCFKTNSDSVT